MNKLCLPLLAALLYSGVSKAQNSTFAFGADLSLCKASRRKVLGI
jgi:hypothetical protein